MSGQELSYPFEVREFDPEELEEVLKRFTKAPHDVYIRIGPKGYVICKGFLKYAPRIYNFGLRPDDAWVVTYPKSGTTWVQEMVWMIANDCDYEGSKTPLTRRYEFLEWSTFFNNKYAQNMAEEYMQSDDENKRLFAAKLKSCDLDICEKRPSPRFIKTHLPLSLLPPALLDTCKVFYVARDPRDGVVSYYHHLNLVSKLRYEIELKQLWNLFINDQLEYTPYFENIKEAWAQRHHPNMMLLFYEDLLKDLPTAVKRVAKFLGKAMTEDQIIRLCDHLSFDSFKKNKSLAPYNGIDSSHNMLVRKGKAGGWRENFDEEMTQQAEKWMADKLRDSGLKFPVT